MTVKKEKIIPVELITAVYWWKCPNCAKENTKTIKRSADHINKLTCEYCDMAIEKEGEIRWTVK
jgi:hypothetical protein